MALTKKEVVYARIKDIKSLIKLDHENQEKIKKRIAKLSSEISAIKVGAST